MAPHAAASSSGAPSPAAATPTPSGASEPRPLRAPRRAAWTACSALLRSSCLACMPPAARQRPALLQKVLHCSPLGYHASSAEWHALHAPH